MKSLQKSFQQRPQFIAYITAGQRGLAFTQQAAIALAKSGVDILEIGVPFSDAVADGPVIAQTMHEVLKTNITIQNILDMITEIKQAVAIPIVLFTYFNPLFKTGLNKCIDQAKCAGVDAILTVDLPLEHSGDYFDLCKTADIAHISMISPTTSSQRTKRIIQSSPAFLYYACRNGITGIKQDLPADYQEKITSIKSLSRLPVVAGFGISSKELAALALKYADGFVVGSYFVKAINEGISPQGLTQLACELDPRARV